MKKKWISKLIFWNKKNPSRNTLHSFKNFFLLFGIQKVQIERNSNKINIHLPSLMSHDMTNYLNSWAGSKATGSYKSECSWWIKVCSKSNSTWNKYAEYLVREQVQLCIHLSSVFNSTTNDSFFKTKLRFEFRTLRMGERRRMFVLERKRLENALMKYRDIWIHFVCLARVRWIQCFASRNR